MAFLDWEGFALSLATSRVTSFVENMRVKRSLTDAFSAGFGSWSLEPSWTGVPLEVGARLGDRLETSTDLIDAGCELPREDGALEFEVLAML